MTPRSPTAYPEAIVFDLDGTLIDSAPDLKAALNVLLREQGRRALELPETILMIGDGARRLVERAFAATGGGSGIEADLDLLTRRFLDIYERAATTLTVPYPGVEATLARLMDAGLALGVCTNKPYRATRRILEELDLVRFFQAVVGGDTLEGIRKPDPRALLFAISEMNAAPTATVMVGDNANDVAAARGAGIPIILVEGGYTGTPAAELGADHVIAGFGELEAALARLS